jgi:hypothetical protein
MEERVVVLKILRMIMIIMDGKLSSQKSGLDCAIYL